MKLHPSLLAIRLLSRRSGSRLLLADPPTRTVRNRERFMAILKDPASLSDKNVRWREADVSCGQSLVRGCLPSLVLHVHQCAPRLLPHASTAASLLVVLTAAGARRGLCPPVQGAPARLGDVRGYCGVRGTVHPRPARPAEEDTGRGHRCCQISLKPVV